MKCHVCSDSSGQEFIVHEMMFGFRDEFAYWQCQECECLQIVNPPSDLSKYYHPKHSPQRFGNIIGLTGLNLMRLDIFIFIRIKVCGCFVNHMDYSSPNYGAILMALRTQGANYIADK
jgi:hypothetical protein